MRPGHRIGRNIAVGGYAVNFGRYTPGDCFHPNGLSFLQADLAGDYEIRLLTQPYTEQSLAEADILLVANPDYPLYERASPYRWTPDDVDALLGFAERGGGILLLINSFLSRPDYWEENFDIERVSLLLDRLGVRWDPNYMSDDKIIEPARSGNWRIGYGQGGRVHEGKLPSGSKALLTYKDNVYGFETPIGKGRLIVLGDTGMISNGLFCFPGFENAGFLREIFGRLTPSWCKHLPTLWDYLGYAHISAAPSKGGLTEATLRALRPEAQWMEDYHYRHLYWEQAAMKGAGATCWQRCPVPLAELREKDRFSTELQWLSIDTVDPGPSIPLDLAVNASVSAGGTDLHLMGRAQSEDLRWSDLCAEPNRLQAAGEIDVVHTVFQLTARLDGSGAPRSATWSQGQIVYARSGKADHYGYEIMLLSESGLIAPRVADR